MSHENLALKAWTTATSQAMEAEGVDYRTRQRVLNRVLFGHPDGLSAEQIIELGHTLPDTD